MSLPTLGWSHARRSILIQGHPVLKTLWHPIILQYTSTYLGLQQQLLCCSRLCSCTSETSAFGTFLRDMIPHLLSMGTTSYLLLICVFRHLMKTILLGRTPISGNVITLMESPFESQHLNDTQKPSFFLIVRDLNTPAQRIWPTQLSYLRQYKLIGIAKLNRPTRDFVQNPLGRSLIDCLKKATEDLGSIARGTKVVVDGEESQGPCGHGDIGMINHIYIGQATRRQTTISLIPNILNRTKQ